MSPEKVASAPTIDLLCEVARLSGQVVLYVPPDPEQGPKRGRAFVAPDPRELARAAGAGR